VQLGKLCVGEREITMLNTAVREGDVRVMLSMHIGRACCNICCKTLVPRRNYVSVGYRRKGLNAAKLHVSV
jgi:hypothetical protein